MKAFFTCVFCCCSLILYSQEKDGFNLLSAGAKYKLANTTDTALYSFAAITDTGWLINYTATLAKMLVNKEQLLRTNSRREYFELLGTYLSFAGDHKNAAIQFDSCDYDKNVNYSDSASAFESMLQGVTFLDARQVILDSARTHNIVMINEAHHQARHRVLTYTLLQDLYKQGYRSFGLETLSTFAFDQKDMVSVKTGYYTIEPNMAELVRFALKIGYHVFAYEATGNDQSVRDSMQAVNIIAKAGNLSAGKLLIHAGYGHIEEESFAGPRMGTILKKLWHEDPFTVDQVNFSEGHRNSIMQGLYNAISIKNTIRDQQPYAMIKNGKSFSIMDGLYDLTVYEPPAQYLHGRPTWLAANGIKRNCVITVPESILKKAFIVQAYIYQEQKKLNLDQCVPFDQSYMLVSNKTDLYLRPEKYLVVFRDVDYHVLKKQVLILNSKKGLTESRLMHQYGN